MRIRRIIVGCVLLLGMLLTISCGTQPDEPLPTPVPTASVTFQRYENAAAFNMFIPTGWDSQVVQEGLLAFATTEDFNLENEQTAVSMVAFRVPPSDRFSVEEELQHFLESGPLAAGFTQSQEPQTIIIDGREGKFVFVQSSDNPSVSAYIVQFRADNNANYTFTGTAPTAVWDEWKVNFQTMIASLKFNE